MPAAGSGRQVGRRGPRCLAVCGADRKRAAQRRGRRIRPGRPPQPRSLPRAGRLGLWGMPNIAPGCERAKGGWGLDDAAREGEGYAHCVCARDRGAHGAAWWETQAPMHDACPQAIRDAMELPGLAEERLAAQGLAEEGLAPSSPLAPGDSAARDQQRKHAAGASRGGSGVGGALGSEEREAAAALVRAIPGAKYKATRKEHGAAGVAMEAAADVQRLWRATDARRFVRSLREALDLLGRCTLDSEKAGRKNGALYPTSRKPVCVAETARLVCAKAPGATAACRRAEVAARAAAEQKEQSAAAAREAAAAKDRAVAAATERAPGGGMLVRGCAAEARAAADRADSAVAEAKVQVAAAKSAAEGGRAVADEFSVALDALDAALQQPGATQACAECARL